MGEKSSFGGGQVALHITPTAMLSTDTKFDKMKYVLSSVLKYLFRLLALPFVLGIVLISQISTLITLSWNFLLYGGELVRFNKETNQKTLYEVYEKLDKCLKEEEL